MSIADLIGKPYVKDCYNGTGFDCWSLINWIYQREGIILPKRIADIWHPRVLAKDIKENISDWDEVGFEAREYLDVLLFATSRNMSTHVGLTLNQKWYIHARPETGVVLNKFSKGFFSAVIKKVYRWRK